MTGTSLFRKQNLNTGGFCLAILACLALSAGSVLAGTSTQDTLTPRQREIERQRRRMVSGETEERRDALAQLGAMHHPDASRIALAGLSDAEPVVRATAAKAILSLPAEQVVTALVPLLDDRDEFVRTEAAYALGRVRSRSSVTSLIAALTDKKDGVRAAAAIALGEIADESAVIPLVQVVSAEPLRLEGKKGRSSRERNQFVRRAAAMALGQIRSRVAVPALIRVLGDRELDSDVKREAARSLGLIGDPVAAPPLRAALTEADPHLAQAAALALERIAKNDQVRR